MRYETRREAVEEWVNSFNAIPQALIEKLLQYNMDELYEITPPSIGDYVYVYTGDYDGEHGEIVSRMEEDKMYVIKLDCNGECVMINEDEFEVEHDGFLPMWGTMWTFNDVCDEEWANGEYLGPHLKEMADCGFRIYEQEDLGIVFGIDGCGYDFYESHWIPLYEKRGLKWSEEDVQE